MEVEHRHLRILPLYGYCFPSGEEFCVFSGFCFSQNVRCSGGGNLTSVLEFLAVLGFNCFSNTGTANFATRGWNHSRGVRRCTSCAAASQRSRNSWPRRSITWHSLNLGFSRAWPYWRSRESSLGTLVGLSLRIGITPGSYIEARWAAATPILVDVSRIPISNSSRNYDVSVWYANSLGIQQAEFDKDFSVRTP